MKRPALLGAYSGVAQVVVNTGLLLVLVPVFIGTLGLKTYGVYALITGIGSLGVFTNFGFSTSLIKHLGEQKDSQESNYDIAVTFIVLGGSSLVVAVVSIVFREFVLTHVLNLSVETITSPVRWFYVACVGTNVVQVVSLIPSAVLDAQQKVYVTNGVQLFVGVLGKVFILCSLLIRPDLATVGWILLGSAVLGLCILIWLFFDTWGTLSFPGLIHRFAGVARKHLMYGKNIYAAGVMGFFYEPATKILISHFVGLNEVGFFEIAFRIKGLVWGLLERLLYPVLPLFAVTTDPQRLRGLMEEIQRALVMMIVPLAVASFFLTQPVVSLWLGGAILPVIIGIISIVNSYLVALLFVPLYHFLNVKGYPQKALILQTINVAANVVLFVLLAPVFGYYGALSAFCLAVLSSSAMCVHFQRSLLGSRPVGSKEFGGKMIKLAAGMVVANLLSFRLFEADGLRLGMLLIANLVSSVALFRQLRLVTVEDVARYIGRNNRIGLTLEKLLIQPL